MSAELRKIALDLQNGVISGPEGGRRIAEITSSLVHGGGIVDSLADIQPIDPTLLDTTQSGITHQGDPLLHLSVIEIGNLAEAQSRLRIVTSQATQIFPADDRSKPIVGKIKAMLAEEAHKEERDPHAAQYFSPSRSVYEVPFQGKTVLTDATTLPVDYTYVYSGKTLVSVHVSLPFTADTIVHFRDGKEVSQVDVKIPYNSQRRNVEKWYEVNPEVVALFDNLSVAGYDFEGISISLDGIPPTITISRTRTFEKQVYQYSTRLKAFTSGDETIRMAVAGKVLAGILNPTYTHLPNQEK